MVDLDSNPTKLIDIVEIGKQMLITRGALTTFSIANDAAKYFAIIPAMLMGTFPVIGYVETHGRKETDALAEDLPKIPRRSIEYRGVTLREMDLDAVLERKPQLALVDELAHTNAPGSRHPKRYQDVREYLQGRHVPGPWKIGQRLLVAISPSPLSEPMARWTRRLADNLQAPWLAVYVDIGRPLSEAEEPRLQQNLALARELGAEVITTTDEDIVSALLRVARQHNVTQIVVGKPAGFRVLDLFRGGSMLSRLIRESGNIDVHCVRAEAGGILPREPRFRRFTSSTPRQYLSALLVVAATTGFNLVLSHWTGYYVVSLVYLLVVVALGLFVGRGPNLVAATLSALAWNFLFVPPLYTFTIATAHDALMFGALLVVALAMGQLTTRLRAQQAAEREREQRATALYLLTRELAEAKDFAQLLGAIIRQLGTVFQADAAVLLPDTADSEELVPYPFGSLEVSEKEASVAAWGFRHGKMAGRGTDTLPSAEAVYLPLLTPARMIM